MPASVLRFNPIVSQSASPSPGSPVSFIQTVQDLSVTYQPFSARPPPMLLGSCGAPTGGLSCRTLSHNWRTVSGWKNSINIR